MFPTEDTDLDVMQVCRNGHVITDRLRGDPESGRSHCERCGAPALDRCPTCGNELPGANDSRGLLPIGYCKAPRHCLTCGASFPWVRKPRAAPDPLATLEVFLRRLPLVIRQLRWRQGDGPPFRVEDERDLEDLLRALLPLRFDDVRLEGRTPHYSSRTRTDLLLAPQCIALTVKYARPGLGESEFAQQWKEDAAYYRQRGGYRTLLSFVYDPAIIVRDVERLESLARTCTDVVEVRCVVGAAAIAGEPGA